MEYDIDSITTKVNSFFEKLKIENNLQKPSILFTYAKQFNAGKVCPEDITNSSVILDNLNNNEEKISNIIVLDSSFNPPTLSHIKLLTETFCFYCDKAISENQNEMTFLNPTFLLLITNNNVDKKLIKANLPQRLKMMEISANIFKKEIILLMNDKYQKIKNKINNINILVGITNVGRFIDKVTAIKQFIPKASPTFIMGWDTITRFFMEKYYVGMNMKEVLDDFFKDSSIICADRIIYEENNNSYVNNNNKEINTLNHFLTEGPAKVYKNKIFILNNWLNDKILCKLSSSEARKILKENDKSKDIRLFLHEEIIEFIFHYNIYN